MCQQHVVRGILCGLLVMAGSAQAQDPMDPMLGGYGVGNSEEIVVIEGQYQTPTDIYIGLYDWNPGDSTLIAKDSIPLVTCTTQDWGPKQVDIAVGDFNCDAKDDIVAVAQTTDTTFDLIIPRFVPGTLTWDIPHILHSSPNALYFDPDIRTDINGNISGLRLLAADLDSIPGQEFVLAYLTPDTQVQLVVYKTDSLLNPIAVDSVLDPDRLFTTRASDCNERSHVFDITAGDFDGDWIDEIMLIGEYRDASDHYVLYSSIYEYSGGSLHRVHRQDSIMWQGRYGGTRTFADRIAVAAADYRGTGRDQALLFMHELGGCEQMTGYLFGLTPSSAMDDMDTVRLIAWNNWWEYTPNNNAATSDHGLSSVDLNLDGRAEFVIKGGRYMKVGSWQENATVTWRSGDILLLGAFDRVTDSRRSVIFADLDADTAQASWTPEIIAGFNDVGSPGHLRTWSVDINSSDSITGITQIHDIPLPAGGGVVPGTWYPLIYAAGDFDGDGVRLGRPNHVAFTHTAEPLVVLNSPPMHFDILGTDTADVLGFYTQGNQEAYARYETNATESQSVTAAHSSNWNFSASAGGTKDLWVGSFSAKVTAAYGGSASRISGTASSHFTSEAVTVIEGDRANVRSVPYDVWEYPFYVGDAMHGYYVVARPRDDQSVKGWSSLAGLPSTSYIPKHEVGNLLSYPSSMADLLNRGDVDTILSDLNSWEVLPEGGGITQTYGVEEITTTESSRSRTFSINLETEAELFGLELSASASHDQTSVQTRSSTLESGFAVSTRLGTLTGAFASAEYRVRPVFYWSTQGALVLDYIVDSLERGDSWWTAKYDSTPDPAFLLPWRYARAKGDSLQDTTKTWRTSDLCFRPVLPVRGEVVTIHGKVWNYSLDSLPQNVEVRLYDGDPYCSETSPLLNTAGDSVVVVAGGIGPRRFKPFEFEWEVPFGAPNNARIYAVLDPNDQIVEIHSNNNKCWRGVFNDAPAPSVCTPRDVTSPVVDLFDPDGGDLLTSGTTHSIHWNSSDDFGTTSCKLEWSADNGAVYALIDSLPFDSGSYAWTVPDTTTDLALIRVTVYDGADNSAVDVSVEPFSIAPPSACLITMTGDVNENSSITSADIIHMVNFVFKGGLAPGPCEAAGDVNCSGTCTSADIIGLVNFVFKGGDPPCDACTTDPATWGCP